MLLQVITHGCCACASCTILRGSENAHNESSWDSLLSEPSFRSIKRLRALLFSPGWDDPPSPAFCYRILWFAGTNFCTVTLREKSPLPLSFDTDGSLLGYRAVVIVSKVRGRLWFESKAVHLRFVIKVRMAKGVVKRCFDLCKDTFDAYQRWNAFDARQRRWRASKLLVSRNFVAPLMWINGDQSRFFVQCTVEPW